MPRSSAGSEPLHVSIVVIPEAVVSTLSGIFDVMSLAGLAPHVSQSGNAPPRAAIAGGRPCVRAALYMAALVAARHHPKLKANYKALRDQGKPGKVALIAIARKLLITANALVRDNTPYTHQTLDS